MIGKDKNGKYHPPKGKPSGSPKKTNENIGAKEIVNESSLVVRDSDIHIRHHNRLERKNQESKERGS